MLMTARGVDCGATSCFPCPARSRLGYPPCLALCFTLLCYVLCFPSPILCFYQVLYPTLSSVLASRAFCLPYLAFGFSLPCPLPYPDLSFFFTLSYSQLYPSLFCFFLSGLCLKPVITSGPLLLLSIGERRETSKRAGNRV